VRAGIDEYQSDASVSLPTSAVEQSGGKLQDKGGHRGRRPQCPFHQSPSRLFTRIETVSA
jgi:hypothetical protein